MTPVFDQVAIDHGIERTRPVGTLVPRYDVPAASRPCSNARCDRLVDDLTEHDEHGRLWCDDGCRDDDSSAVIEQLEKRVLAVFGAGPLVRPLHAGPPRDFPLRRF